MKILNIFCDMLRPDTLSLFNDNLVKKDSLDLELEKLGGTIYKNVFAVNPDTGRGIAGFFTGRFAKAHECMVMAQYPENFLNMKLYNLNNLFEEKKIKNYFLCKEDYYKLGYIPKDTKGLVKIRENKRNDYKEKIKKIAEEIKEEKDAFIFFTFSDFHDVMTLENYTMKKIKQGKEQLNKIIKYVFEVFDKDDFDYIFIFSDHGCCYDEEIKEQLYLVSDNRTRITLQVRKKYENTLKENLELRSLLDLFPTWCSLYNKDIKCDGISLFEKNSLNRKIVIESSSKFATDIWAISDLWSIVTKEEIIMLNKKDKLTLKNRIGEKEILFSSSLTDREIYEVLEKETIFFKDVDIEIKKDIKKPFKRLIFSDGTLLKKENQSYIYVFLRYLIAKTLFYETIKKMIR